MNQPNLDQKTGIRAWYYAFRVHFKRHPDFQRRDAFYGICRNDSSKAGRTGDCAQHTKAEQCSIQHLYSACQLHHVRIYPLYQSISAKPTVPKRSQNCFLTGLTLALHAIHCPAILHFRNFVLIQSCPSGKSRKQNTSSSFPASIRWQMLQRSAFPI